MRKIALCWFVQQLLTLQLAPGQNSAPRTIRTVPTFTGSFVTNGRRYSYTFAGQNPESGGATTIETVLVPLSLSFDASTGGKKVTDAAGVVPEVLNSPIFQTFPFATGNTQYGDAVQRAEFYKTATAQRDWHTVLGLPRILPPIQIDIPVANGYVLHSRTGTSLAIVDLDFVKKELFERLASTEIEPDKLVMVLTRNIAFYSLGDATVCCSVGAHGAQLDSSGASARSFVIGSYFDKNVIPHYTDIQGISQQVAEWMNDPLYGYRSNEFPGWLKPPSNIGCGGHGESSAYLMEQPADYLPKSNSTPLIVHGKTFHLENIALLPWFAQGAAAETFQGAYSFPDTNALPAAAQPCSSSRKRDVQPSASPVTRADTAPNGHALIGYWEGYESATQPVRLRDVSPQWDIIIATFAAPVKGSTSILRFEPPAPIGEAEFKADIAYLQDRGKKVLISIGGGGQVVTLNTPEDLRNFVSSASAIVEKYGFDGVDLDIETPSLLINSGDRDFRHPTTPSIVNLIAAMHQMRDHFGSHFMIAEVPEAAQAQAGMQAYGGQFGSFLPVIYGTRDILSFVDAQDYNTPPLEGLDGNYYFPGTAEYHVALSEMLVAGFPVGGDPHEYFPPLPPEKVAIGFPATPTSARNYTEIPAIEGALSYLIEGKRYAGAQYRLRRPFGYRRFLGAMFWAINEDRRNDYRMSNAIGPFLHGMGTP
ncbi:MAG TPA: chitinase [Bryobacteraceae bacterium]|jgi:chitinase|nr:chitinase [Bryobacteraceae bacterium]